MSIIRFDTVPPEVMQAMCTPMHLIVPSSGSIGALYMGSMTAINDTDLLQEHSITHLVQVLDIAWLPAAHAGFKCYRIDIRDSTSADLRPHLESACSYIDTALLSNENVLVHCQQVRIVFSNGSIPANPILIHHWFPPGHFTERSHRDRLPDSKSQHVARRCICPRQGQAGLHETKFGFRSMPSGVGG